jgi:hypothetical protein
VQLGIPMATALFGDEGLAIHIPLVSLHALILTVGDDGRSSELDLARRALRSEAHSSASSNAPSDAMSACPPPPPPPDEAPVAGGVGAGAEGTGGGFGSTTSKSQVSATDLPNASRAPSVTR